VPREVEVMEIFIEVFEGEFFFFFNQNLYTAFEGDIIRKDVNIRWKRAEVIVADVSGAQQEHLILSLHDNNEE
jgi:hypothetical protein